MYIVQRLSLLGVAFALHAQGTYVPSARTIPIAGEKTWTYEDFWSFAQQGYGVVIRQMLQSGADPDAQDPNNGESAMIIAAVHGHIDIIRILLKAGATVDLATDRGAAALLVASQQGHARIVGVLLDAGANPNLPDHAGATPLGLAAQQGHADAVDTLLDKGGVHPDQTDGFGQTGLFITAKKNKIAVAKVLLQHGADPNLPASSATTPIMVAMDRSHVDLARLLLRAGAKTSTYIREILSYGDIGFECDGDTDCINNDEQQLKCKSGICRQQEPQRKTVSLSATKLNRGSNIEQKQRLSRLDEVLDGMSVIELKKYITAAGLSYSDCVGKKSLHIRAREAIALISPKTDAQSVVWQQKMLENPELFKSAEAIAHAKTNYEEDPIAYLRYLENHHDIAQMVELSNPGFLAKYGIKRPTLKVTKEAPITGEILDAMSVKELKQYISAAGLLYSDCVEKKELHARAREASVQIMNRARDLTRNDDIEPPEFLATTSESSSPTAACGAENEEQEEVKGEPDTCNLAKWREEIRQMHKGSVGPVKGFGMQMMVACLHGYEHIVKELVNTMFGLAVKNKGEILDNLVDKNTTSPSFGLNPMGQAAQMGYINIVELLIAAGANPNCTKSVNQSSAIFLASLNGHAKLVWTLTERHHVITTGQTAHGSTPLMAAASGNHSNVVRVLLNSWDSNAAKHNINVVEHHSEGKDSALHIAARSGHANVADLLVNAGAHINLLDSTGSTPLFGALENDHPDVAQILVDAGAKLDLQNNDGSTALMKLAFNREGSDIEGGPGNPNPDWQPQPGRRQDSNHAKHIAAAKIVIDAGADLDKVRPDDGMTALMLAAYQGDVSIVKLLLEGNAAIHIRTLPQTDFVYGPPGEATAKEIAQLAADSSWGNAGNRMVERMIAREERRRRRKKKARPVRTQANKQTAAEYPEVANAAKRLQESMLKLLETMDYLLTDNSVLEQGRVKKKRS